MSQNYVALNKSAAFLPVGAVFGGLKPPNIQGILTLVVNGFSIQLAKIRFHHVGSKDLKPTWARFQAPENCSTLFDCPGKPLPLCKERCVRSLCLNTSSMRSERMVFFVFKAGKKRKVLWFFSECPLNLEPGTFADVTCLFRFLVPFFRLFEERNPFQWTMS